MSILVSALYVGTKEDLGLCLTGLFCVKSEGKTLRTCGFTAFPPQDKFTNATIRNAAPASAKPIRPVKQTSLELFRQSPG